MREIAEARIRKHQPLLVEARRKHRNPPLEVIVEADPRRPRVPEIPVVVLESIAVAGTRHKSTRFIGYWVVRRVSERAQWMIPHISSVCVHVVFGSGRGVLKIIFAAVLRHP